MNVYEAAKCLDEMAQKGEPIKRKATMVHLFGIRYARELEQLNLRDVVRISELDYSWVTEIRKGMNLAEYVTIR
jgi:hypothetical protein